VIWLAWAAVKEPVTTKVKMSVPPCAGKPVYLVNWFKVVETVIADPDVNSKALTPL